jgi:hypothetical protein
MNIAFIKVEVCTLRGGSVNSLLFEMRVVSDVWYKWPYKHIHRSVSLGISINIENQLKDDSFASIIFWNFSKHLLKNTEATTSVL